MQKIPLSRPSITEAEISRVTKVLRSGRLALGPEIIEFERRMCQATGSNFAVATSSGTAALHLIVRSLGIGTGDEVITTPYSFIASSNALLFEGATPVFVDIEPDTFNINPDLIEDAITERTKAILAVDVFGCPADWTRLREIANSHDIALIDDSCEALGATYGGQPLGSQGDASAFGFYPNKQVTTGEGGCITTNSESIASLCRSMLNQGRAHRDRMEHVRLGYNYRLSEVAAAIGCAQLERLNELLAKRENLAAHYSKRLREETPLILPSPHPGRSWFVYVVRVPEGFTTAHRDQIIHDMAEEGIACAPYFPSIHTQPFYKDTFGYQRRAFPVAEAVSDSSLAIPFYPDMSMDDADRVSTTLAQVVRRIAAIAEGRRVPLTS